MSSKDDRQPLVNGGAVKTEGKPWENVLAQNTAGQLLNVPANCAWHYGVLVTEVRTTDLGEVWRFMVKGTRKRQAVAMFAYADSYVQALEVGLWLIEKGTATWKPDAYPVKVRLDSDLPRVAQKD